MISFTAVVFSVTMVILQLSSSQYSSRVLRRFLHDRLIQSSLGVFVATFTYAMVVLRAVRGGSGGAGFVPRMAVTGAFVLVLASVALFLAQIGHVVNMIRVATIIASIGMDTRRTLSARPAGRPDRPGYRRGPGLVRNGPGAQAGRAGLGQYRAAGLRRRRAGRCMTCCAGW
jgi:uncharacterized membrane protein